MPGGERRLAQRIMRKAAGILLASAFVAILSTGRVEAAGRAPDNGTGTIDFPAPNYYLSPDEVMEIIDGLPPGTTIELAPVWGTFSGLTEAPGGILGGHVQTFNSVMEWNVHGTGALSGFDRVISLNLVCETHTGPRTPGDAVQGFDTQLASWQGEIFGDPDFSKLRLVGGTDLGLPSPGRTTLTRLGPPGSDFAVDSFFDITYQIDFVGAPGSQLDGLAGVTTATIHFEQTPEPATLALLALGACGLVARRRRK